MRFKSGSLHRYLRHTACSLQRGGTSSQNTAWLVPLSFLPTPGQRRGPKGAGGSVSTGTAAPGPPPSGPASLGKAPRGADTRRVSEPAARRRTPTYHPRGSLCSASPDQPSGWHPECHGDHGIRSIFSRNETRGAGAWLSLTQDVAEFPLVRVNILGNQFIPGYPFLLRRIEMKVVHGRKLTCGKQRSVLPQS